MLVRRSLGCCREQEGQRVGQWEEDRTKGESGLRREEKETVCLYKKSLKASVCVQVTRVFKRPSPSRAEEEVG